MLIVACGTGWVYSREAVKLLSVEKAVGILKLGATWPLPTKLVSKHLLQAEKVLVIEEVDAFLEGNLKELAATLAPGRTWTFFGKETGHISPCGENNVDIALNAISRFSASTGRRESLSLSVRAMKSQADSCCRGRCSSVRAAPIAQPIGLLSRPCFWMVGTAW